MSRRVKCAKPARAASLAPGVVGAANLAVSSRAIATSDIGDIFLADFRAGWGFPYCPAAWPLARRGRRRFVPARCRGASSVLTDCSWRFDNVRQAVETSPPAPVWPDTTYSYASYSPL